MIDLIRNMRKIDAADDPAEANGLLIQAAALLETYQGQLEAIGKMLGPEAYARADGSIGPVVVIATVAEIAGERLADLNRMRECLLQLYIHEGLSAQALKAAACDIRDAGVTPEVLRRRFNRH